MVLAARIQRDVTHHDHLVVVGALDDRDELRGVLPDAGEDLLVHPCHARRGLAESPSVGVLAGPLEDQADALLDPLRVEAVRLLERIHRSRCYPGTNASRADGSAARSRSSPARGRSLDSPRRLIHTHGSPTFAHGSTSW